VNSGGGIIEGPTGAEVRVPEGALDPFDVALMRLSAIPQFVIGEFQAAGVPGMVVAGGVTIQSPGSTSSRRKSISHSEAARRARGIDLFHPAQAEWAGRAHRLHSGRQSGEAKASPYVPARQHGDPKESPYVPRQLFRLTYRLTIRLCRNAPIRPSASRCRCPSSISSSPVGGRPARLRHQAGGRAPNRWDDPAGPGTLYEAIQRLEDGGLIAEADAAVEPIHGRRPSAAITR